MPEGMARLRSWTIASSREWPSSSARTSEASKRTPQLMSYPTPPGEMMPSCARNAATPPTGKPYPSWASGMAWAVPAMPGRVETLTSWLSVRSREICFHSSSSAQTRAGTRMSSRAVTGTSTRFGLSRVDG